MVCVYVLGRSWTGIPSARKWFHSPWLKGLFTRLKGLYGYGYITAYNVAISTPLIPRGSQPVFSDRFKARSVLLLRRYFQQRPMISIIHV